MATQRVNITDRQPIKWNRKHQIVSMDLHLLFRRAKAGKLSDMDKKAYKFFFGPLPKVKAK